MIHLFRGRLFPKYNDLNMPIKFNIQPDKEQVIQDDFDKRMYNPETDKDKFGYVKNDSPRTSNKWEQANDDLKQKIRGFKNSAASLVHGDNWQAGITQADTKGFKAALKVRF